MSEILFSSVTRLVERILTRELTAVEVVQAHLSRIDEVNPALNAVVTRCDETALEHAARADAALARGDARGPLHGVPFTIKDAFDTAGLLSTGGTTGHGDYVPDASATVVKRLQSAGAILMGKTNTPELTLYYDTDNLVFGRTCNPYDLTRSPGGSSGGSAAIVAAGGSPFDIGSDTGGSIRLPAHCCGIAGLKPTQGRVPRTGFILPGGVPVDSLTQVGPLARYVDDLALLLDVISGPDGHDCAAIPGPSTSGPQTPVEGLRVGYYVDHGDMPAAPEVAAAVETAARLLAERGARITEARPPGVEASRSLFGRVFATDGGAWVRRRLEECGTVDVHPFLRWTEKREDAEETPASVYTALGEELDRFRSRMLSVFADCDAILAPVHSSSALHPESITSDTNRPGYGYSQAYNLTGWPCVVVRAGACERGLPIGVQVVAAPWQEPIALALARCIEDGTGGWQAPDGL